MITMWYNFDDYDLYIWQDRRFTPMLFCVVSIAIVVQSSTLPSVSSMLLPSVTFMVPVYDMAVSEITSVCHWNSLRFTMKIVLWGFMRLTPVEILWNFLSLLSLYSGTKLEVIFSCMAFVYQKYWLEFLLYIGLVQIYGMYRNSLVNDFKKKSAERLEDDFESVLMSGTPASRHSHFLYASKRV